MNFFKNHLHDIYKNIHCPKGFEQIDTVFSGKSFRIERIVSNGAKSPKNFWYDQKEDEYVFLLQGKAEIAFENGDTIAIKKGAGIFIPAHIRHRVEYTSSKPECIWLCIFAENTNKKKLRGNR